ncbi:hypothetical protein [Bradyrhizobium yuanmingense]|uniref:hypothetical protein n=1 Tax=Bradyrhizobium yuanmingense TaxID=108015 RepID=UPI001FF050B0|nr:hypothetical protein [Bradyrhizobium yuanmingense]
MSEGQIRTEVHGHVLKIIIANAAKRNAFTPAMMKQLSDALTELHDNDAYRVGVVCAEGGDFTAGLDMPKFFGPTAEAQHQGRQCRPVRAQQALPQADRDGRAGYRLHHRHRVDARR